MLCLSLFEVCVCWWSWVRKVCAAAWTTLQDGARFFDLLGNQSLGASWMATLEAPTASSRVTARTHSCHSTAAVAVASCGQDVVGAFVPHSSVETCRRPTASPWPRRPWFLCVVGVLGDHYDHWPTWILKARRDGYDKADWTTSESLDCRVQGSNMFAVDGPLLEGNHVLEWAWGIHLVSNPNLWIHKFTLEILLALIDIDVKSRYNPARDFWLADDKAWSALAVHRTLIVLSTIPPPLTQTTIVNLDLCIWRHLELEANIPWPPRIQCNANHDKHGPFVVDIGESIFWRQ